MQQPALAERFHALHVRGQPLVLFNAWDAGSARAVAAAGASAIATGSWSVAAASGYEDGEALPLELALENLRRIVGAVPLPVTIDLESGYGATPAQVGATIARAIAAGAVGCNLEDSDPGQAGVLRPLADHAARLLAARDAAARTGVRFFLNARCDVYLQAGADAPARELRAAALERAAAYADAGADGLFLPGLVDTDEIAAIAAATSLPLNIMMSPATPAADTLARAGVARISHGPGPYRLAMRAVEEAARAAISAVSPLRLS